MPFTTNQKSSCIFHIQANHFAVCLRHSNACFTVLTSQVWSLSLHVDLFQVFNSSQWTSSLLYFCQNLLLFWGNARNYRWIEYTFGLIGIMKLPELITYIKTSFIFLYDMLFLNVMFKYANYALYNEICTHLHKSIIPEQKSKHWTKPGSKFLFHYVDILESKGIFPLFLSLTKPFFFF